MMDENNEKKRHLTTNPEESSGYSTFNHEGDQSAEKGDHYTVEDAIEKFGFGKFQIWITGVAGIAWLADSMEIMILSIIGPVLQCEWGLTNVEVAMVTTVVFAGFLIGCPAMGAMGDRFGRKKTLTFCAAWAFYFGALSGFCANYAWLLVLRMITGIGIGGLPQTVTYYSEFLPKKSRGRSIMLLEVFFAIGGAVEVVLAIIILPYLGWRAWISISSFPMLLFMLLCWWIPTSPRFDESIGQLSKAEETLKKMSICNKQPMPKGVLVTTKQKKGSRGTCQDLFAPKMRLTTILLWLIWFINGFMYYGVILMSTEIISHQTECVKNDIDSHGSIKLDCRLDCTGLKTSDLVAILLAASAELPGLLIGAVLVDPFGRKKTMILLSFLTCSFIFLLFVCVNKNYITGLLFVIRALASCNLQVVYIYTPESYPTECRGIGLGCCSACARIGAMITPFFAQVLMAYSLFLGLSVYAMLNVVLAGIVFLLPHETAGKDLGASSKNGKTNDKD